MDPILAAIAEVERRRDALDALLSVLRAVVVVPETPAPMKPVHAWPTKREQTAHTKKPKAAVTATPRGGATALAAREQAVIVVLRGAKGPLKTAEVATKARLTNYATKETLRRLVKAGRVLHAGATLSSRRLRGELATTMAARVGFHCEFSELLGVKRGEQFDAAADQAINNLRDLIADRDRLRGVVEGLRAKLDAIAVEAANHAGPHIDRNGRGVLERIADLAAQKGGGA